MAEQWKIFAEALGHGSFILGDELSAVDIYAAMLAEWNVDVPAFFAEHPNVKALYDRVRQVPAFDRVWARNNS